MGKHSDHGKLRPAELKIHLDSLANNYQILRGLSQNDFFCPMIKADAYGHGAQEVGQLLHELGCSHVGVALFEEAVALRDAGLNQFEILVFSPFYENGLEVAAQYNLTPVLGCSEDIFRLADSDFKGEVHLKINMGMNRLGFSLNEAESLLAKHDIYGLCTHFPFAEDLFFNDGDTRGWLRQFLSFAESHEFKCHHALNSAGLLSLAALGDPLIGSTGSRPGIAFYGIGLSKEHRLPAVAALKEAMTLRSQIVHIQNVKKGETVSYMGQWVASEDSLVGVIPIGYADGLRRALSGQIHVIVDGVLCPLVGLICMDYVMVDLTQVGSKGRVGQLVEFQMTTQAWAQLLDTIPYEVMTGFSGRLPRVYR